MGTKQGYTTTKWSGKSNYECDSCQFATLNEADIKEHVKFHDLGAVAGNAPAATDTGGDK